MISIIERLQHRTFRGGLHKNFECRKKRQRGGYFDPDGGGSLVRVLLMLRLSDNDSHGRPDHEFAAMHTDEATKLPKHMPGTQTALLFFRDVGVLKRYG